MKRHTFNRDEFAADELENGQYFLDAESEDACAGRAESPEGDGMIPDGAYNEYGDEPYSRIARYTMIPDPADDAHIANMAES